MKYGPVQKRDGSADTRKSERAIEVVTVFFVIVIVILLVLLLLLTIIRGAPSRPGDTDFPAICEEGGNRFKWRLVP